LIVTVALFACHYDEYTPQPSHPVYTIHELGLLPAGTQSQANSGSAAAFVGWATASDNSRHAVTFAGGQAHPLTEPPGATSSEARGVNASGTIVGFASIGGVGQAVVWPSATAAPMLLPTLGGVYGFAGAINDAGAILGTTETAAQDTVLVTWQPNAGGYQIEPVVVQVDSTHVDTVGLNYEAAGINNLGQLAGNLPVDLATSGFFWSKQALDSIEGPDGSETDANGVNNLGMVVGSFDSQSGTRAFLYTNALGAFQVAPPPTGYSDVELNSINDSGRVAGANLITAAGVTMQSVAVTGTALDSGKTLMALPTLGGSFNQPQDNAITTCGVILGWASKGAANTPEYAVAWVPEGCTIP
jgi:probable HAF family extracellular repeat protein